MGSDIEVTFSKEISFTSFDDDKNIGIKVHRNDELPDSFNWRDQNLVTVELNQHIPQYCGSCWVHSTVSTIADRLKIQNKGIGRDVIPSVQAVLNCGRLVGSCSGGDVHALLRWWNKNPLPDVTCMAYEARDGTCSENGYDFCRTCNSTGLCAPVTEYRKVKVEDYYRVVGDDNIMQEIYKNGPVICYLNSDCIDNYTGGVSMYNESYTGEECKTYNFNHAISIAGWGVDSNGVKYWVSRNSWGTYYGEGGWFNIVRGGAYNPIGCYAATASIENI